MHKLKNNPFENDDAVNKEYVDDSILTKQDKTDNTLETTDKTVVGAINEINDSLLDNATDLTRHTDDTDIHITADEKASYVKKADIVDNLTSTDTEKPLSAKQGYVLSQMFAKDVKITQNNELIITYFNGNTFVYDLSTFLNTVINSIAYGKCIACDELPTCTSYVDAFNNTQYEVTYKKDGLEIKCDAKNTWFYYEIEVDAVTHEKKWVQTLFVEGREVTLEAGKISDVIKIDSTTKHWLINGVDSGVVAEGDSIEENTDNTSTIYKLDIKKADGTTKITPNLKGADGVILDNVGYYGFGIENDQLMLYVNVPDASSSDVDDQAPPFSLDEGNLYYTVGGTIKYVSKTIV